MNLNTFTTALSGLEANSQGLSVVGNNLANLNTVGFKQSNISFGDVLGAAYAAGINGTGVVNIGNGVQVGQVRASFAPGSIQTTNNPMDVAIQGKGFLVENGPDGTFYTRAGNLSLDANNNLLGNTGMNVQGYMMNPTTGKVDANLGLQNIQLPSGLASPSVTSQFQLAMNLDSTAPSGTQFTTSVQVYDSLGTAHVATMSLQKEISAATPPVTRWRFDLTIPQKEVAGADPASTDQLSLITGLKAVVPPAAGALMFDSNGKMTSAYFGADPAVPPAVGNLQVPPKGVTLPTMAGGGTLSPSLSWNLTNPSSKVSAFSSPSGVTSSSQNGAAAGTLTSMTVQPDGTVTASFSNGKTIGFAQIALAQFGNEGGLTPAGQGLYKSTAASGDGSVGGAGSAGRGNLVGGALEGSNVDLASELTQIITYQRAYQANAKMITTTDQILQQTMAMTQ